MYVSIFLAILAAALFGAATPLSKAFLGTIGPFTLAGLLYLGAGIALAPWALRGLGSRVKALNGRNRLYVLGSVIAGGIVGPVLLLFGLRAASSSSVSLWLNMELVATAILGHFLFRDTMTRRSAISALGILSASASVLLSLSPPHRGRDLDLGGRPSCGRSLFRLGFRQPLCRPHRWSPAGDEHFQKGNRGGSREPDDWPVRRGKFRDSASLTRRSSRHRRFLIWGKHRAVYCLCPGARCIVGPALFLLRPPLFGLALAAILLGETPTVSRAVALGLMGLSWGSSPWGSSCVYSCSPKGDPHALAPARRRAPRP